MTNYVTYVFCDPIDPTPFHNMVYRENELVGTDLDLEDFCWNNLRLNDAMIYVRVECWPTHTEMEFHGWDTLDRDAEGNAVLSVASAVDWGLCKLNAGGAL